MSLSPVGRGESQSLYSNESLDTEIRTCSPVSIVLFKQVTGIASPYLQIGSANTPPSVRKNKYTVDRRRRSIVAKLMKKREDVWYYNLRYLVMTWNCKEFLNIDAATSVVFVTKRQR